MSDLSVSGAKRHTNLVVDSSSKSSSSSSSSSCCCCCCCLIVVLICPVSPPIEFISNINISVDLEGHKSV